MPYADSDFFLAIIKSEDWLKEKALTLYNKNRGKLWTSSWTLIEMMLVSEKHGIDPEMLVSSICEIAQVSGAEKEKIFTAACLMKKYNMNTFDALHAVSCGQDKIISSDSVFDRLGLQRIPLER